MVKLNGKHQQSKLKQDHWKLRSFWNKGLGHSNRQKTKTWKVMTSSCCFLGVCVTFHMMLLLLLLSRFSRVRFCATPETAAHQAPPSLGFSRQEHWSGLPFPSPMHESESEVAQVVYLKVTQSCLTPSDPMDCSPPGSSVHGYEHLIKTAKLCTKTKPWKEHKWGKYLT